MNRLNAPKSVAYLLPFFSVLLLSNSQARATANFTTELDSTIRDYAFKDQPCLRQTGSLCQVSLPANLFGIVEASAIRLRTASFWSKGTTIYSFIRIPPRIIPVPYVKRLLIVYQNLANLSSSSYSDAIPGYSLVAPVVGFLAYNASATSPTELDLQVSTGDHIVINFPQVRLPDQVMSSPSSSSIKCAKFRRDGSVQIGDVVEGVGINACLAMGTGHFTIVVPSAVVPALGGKGRRSRRWILVGACGGGGVVGLGLGLVGIGILKVAKNKKMEGMEGEADEGEALGSVFVRGSKMPSAAMTRTQPVLETGGSL